MHYEPETCKDADFAAHYFFRKGTEPAEDISGFLEYGGAMIRTSGFELIGQRVFDNSKNGELFVGAVPNLESLPDVTCVRVGEESPNSWEGETFKRDEQTLAKVLNGRQGRFFVRVYDANADLLDFGEFRYLHNLKEIRINDEAFIQQTIFVPPPTGHSLAKVSFVGVDGTTLRPILSSELPHVKVQGNTLFVEPHPDGDAISCTLESDKGCVDTVLKLPRIWWRMERDGTEPAKWRDTHLAMKRNEFRQNVEENMKIRLRLPQREKTVIVRFDEEFDQKYHSRKEVDTSVVSIPLIDFIDHKQIRQRFEDVSINIRCGDSVLTVVQILAEPMSEIVSFTWEVSKTANGEKTILRWITRNTEAVGVGVSIEPEIGAVEPNGSLEVTSAGARTYTLKLTASGMNDVTQTVAVTSTLSSDKTSVVCVRCAGERWRRGRGFSRGELLAMDLTVAEAMRQSIPLDRRRRTVHLTNVKTIGRLIDA